MHLDQDAYGRVDCCPFVEMQVSKNCMQVATMIISESTFGNHPSTGLQRRTCADGRGMDVASIPVERVIIGVSDPHPPSVRIYNGISAGLGTAARAVRSHSCGYRFQVIGAWYGDCRRRTIARREMLPNASECLHTADTSAQSRGSARVSLRSRRYDRTTSSFRALATLRRVALST